MTLKEAAEKFVELTVWIRELSSPQLTYIDNEETYREKLLVNFHRVGEIAQINAGLLNDYLNPLLESEHLLSEEEISVLLDLKNNLLNAYTMDNLDTPFLYLISLRLCEDAERKKDANAIIRSLDDYVMATYALLSMVRRIYPYSDSALGLKENGLYAAKRILNYLPEDKLKTLSDLYARESVLINSRYITTLYEYPLTKDDSKFTENILEILRRALSLIDNPTYRELVPDFDWIYHEFRTLHYCCAITIFHNSYGFNDEQLQEINTYAKRLANLWEKEHDYLKERNKDETIKFAIVRCAYLAKEISKEEYKKELRLLSKARRQAYNADEMQLRSSVPIEYILTLDPNNISKEDGEVITEYYRELIKYIHSMPKLGHFSFLVSELIFLLEHFIEIEGGISFETMCIELLAAIHPPTYVHSISVADLSVCLTKHLYNKHPELFNDVTYPDIEAMKDYIWHAASCHDIGKIFIIETIITYGRSLYDEEINWIHTHSEAGAALLSKHEKTKDYIVVVLGHHRWYNNKGGYPENYNPENSKNRILVDIVACADCLDAATDSIGRSYKKGKTLDDFIVELKEGSGTRYAPFLLELFEDKNVYNELKTILNEGRDEKYRRTYRILDNMMH